MGSFEKSKVHVDKPSTPEALKIDTGQETAAVRPETLRKVTENAERRARMPFVPKATVLATSFSKTNQNELPRCKMNEKLFRIVDSCLVFKTIAEKTSRRFERATPYVRAKTVTRATCVYSPGRENGE